MNICGSPYFLIKRYLRCPICECVTEMVQCWHPWLGSTFGCCRCGDGWDGGTGELLERPFARGWRWRQARAYQQKWLRARHAGPSVLWGMMREAVADEPVGHGRGWA